jgi:putative membrane protein
MKLFKKKDEEIKDEKVVKKKKHLSKAKKEKIRLQKKEEKRIAKENKVTKERKFDLSPLFGGIGVGIANIIPGVSGGTILVIFNLFEKLMNAISDVFKKETDTRKKSILFILEVLIGAVIGIVAFAKLLGITLAYMEAETIFWFMGLILFSIPVVISNELKGERFNILFFLIGIIIIGVLQYFNMKNPINTVDTAINLKNILVLIGLGVIGGISMIFPGISGSMVMLVLGKYETIRSLIDNVTTFKVNILIQLVVFGIAAVIGIIISAKVLSKVINKYRGKVISLILGFITASALILPLNLSHRIHWTTPKTCSILIAFIFGGIVIYYINKLKNRNS